MDRINNKSNKKEAVKEELSSILEELSKKYPGVDIEGMMLEKCMKKANENKKSEMMEFKTRAEATFGTTHEMSFCDIESGLFSSMLADGRNTLKDIMEKISCKHPVNSNGEKMTDRGKEKKHNLLFRVGPMHCKNAVHR